MYKLYFFHALKNALRHKMSFLLIWMLALVGAQSSFAALVEIDDGQSANLSEVMEGDSVAFIGNTGSPSEGILNVDADGVLGVEPLTFESGAISSSFNSGKIDFVSTSTLTVLGNLDVNALNFSEDGVLNYKGSSFSVRSGITTSVDGTGSIVINTDEFLNAVRGDIGTESKKLKLITVTDSKYPVFRNNIYVDKFILRNSDVAFAFSYDGEEQPIYDIGEISIESGSTLVSADSNFVNFNSTGAGVFEVKTGFWFSDGGSSVNAGILNFSGTSSIASNMEYYIYNKDPGGYLDDSPLSSLFDDDPLAGYIELAESSSLTIADGITLTVNAVDLNLATTPDTEFKIVDYSADGAVLNIDISSINVISNIVDTYFNLFDNGSFLYLKSTDVAPRNGQVALLQGDEFGFANVVNDQLTSQGNMLTLRNRLLGISDVGQLKNFAKTLSPSKQSTQVAVSQVGNKISKILSSRTSKVNSNDSGFSTGDNATKHGAWGEFFGGSANQGVLSNQEAYDLKVMGMIFGVDKGFDFDGDVNTTIGASFSYAESSIDMLGAGDKAVDINSYQMSLYNHNGSLDGLGFYNENMINAGINHYKTQRTIDGIGVASGNFKGEQYGAKTAVGYNLQLSNNVTLSPNASVNFYRAYQDNYEETGAGNVGLKVEAKPFNIFLASLGMKMNGKIKVFGTQMLPELTVDWIRNLKKEGQETRSSFIAGGDAVTSSSNSLLKDVINFGTKVAIISGDASSISLGYDLQAGHEFRSHTGSLKYRWNF